VRSFKSIRNASRLASFEVVAADSRLTKYSALRLKFCERERQTTRYSTYTIQIKRKYNNDCFGETSTSVDCANLARLLIILHHPAWCFSLLEWML